LAAHQPVTTAQGEARALARDWGVESDFSRGSGRPIFELGHCSRNTLGSVELLGLDALGVGVSRFKRALPGAHQGGARGGSRCHNGESDRHNLSHLSQFVTPAPPHPRPRAAFAAALRAGALAAGATLKYSGNPVRLLLSTERPHTAAHRVAETLALEGTGLGLKCRLNSFSLRTARATRRGGANLSSLGAPVVGPGLLELALPGADLEGRAHRL
jgi:hypothetical protein